MASRQPSCASVASPAISAGLLPDEPLDATGTAVAVGVGVGGTGVRVAVGKAGVEVAVAVGAVTPDVGEAQELVGAAIFLASHKASSFVTGADIRIDGGFLAQTI